MQEIDMTIPRGEFRVPTSVVRDGVAYMGPDVRINATSSQDAVRRVHAAGHTPNKHFGPTRIK